MNTIIRLLFLLISVSAFGQGNPIVRNYYTTNANLGPMFPAQIINEVAPLMNGNWVWLASHGCNRQDGCYPKTPVNDENIYLLFGHDTNWFGASGNPVYVEPDYYTNHNGPIARDAGANLWHGMYVMAYNFDPYDPQPQVQGIGVARSFDLTNWTRTAVVFPFGNTIPNSSMGAPQVFVDNGQLYLIGVWGTNTLLGDKHIFQIRALDDTLKNWSAPILLYYDTNRVFFDPWLNKINTTNYLMHFTSSVSGFGWCTNSNLTTLFRNADSLGYYFTNIDINANPIDIDLVSVFNTSGSNWTAFGRESIDGFTEVSYSKDGMASWTRWVQATVPSSIGFPYGIMPYSVVSPLSGDGSALSNVTALGESPLATTNYVNRVFTNASFWGLNAPAINATNISDSHGVIAQFGTVTVSNVSSGVTWIGVGKGNPTNALDVGGIISASLSINGGTSVNSGGPVQVGDGWPLLFGSRSVLNSAVPSGGLLGIWGPPTLLSVPTNGGWIFLPSSTFDYSAAESPTGTVVHSTGTNFVISDPVLSPGFYVSGVPTNGVAPPTSVNQPLGCFGSMCQSNVTNTVTTTGAGTYVVLTNYQTIRTNQFIASPAKTIGSGYLTNLIAGYYRIYIYATMLPGNNDTIEIEFQVNGIGREEISALHTYDAAARADTLSAEGILYLPALSYCAITINNRSSTSTIAVWRAGITIGTP